LKLIEGGLPKRVIGLVLEWTFEHRADVWDNGADMSPEFLYEIGKPVAEPAQMRAAAA